MRNRLKIIEHRGKDILLIDLSHSLPIDIAVVIEQSKATICRTSSDSLLVLADVTNAKFNGAVSDQLKEFVLHNGPFVRASAVVGVRGLQTIVFDALRTVSQKRLESFKDMDEALEWLCLY